MLKIKKRLCAKANPGTNTGPLGLSVYTLAILGIIIIYIYIPKSQNSPMNPFSPKKHFNQTNRFSQQTGFTKNCDNIKKKNKIKKIFKKKLKRIQNLILNFILTFRSFKQDQK